MYVHFIGLNACKSNPCQHDGRCGKTERGFQCTCKGNYVGVTCGRRYYAVTVTYFPIPTYTYACMTVLSLACLENE